MSARTLVVTCFLAMSCGGWSGASEEARDVSGNYALAWDDRLTVRLSVGGAVREVTQTGLGGVVDFGVIDGEPVTLDLTTFCAREEVRCPSEALWSKVALYQPDLSNGGDLQKLVIIDDTRHELDAGERAPSLAGLVDHAQQDRFLLGLGLEGGVSGSCAALGVSLAGGRFSRGAACSLDAGEGEVTDAGLEPDGGEPDGGTPEALLPDGGVDCALADVTRLVVPAGARVKGLTEGRVFVGWAAGCALGPVLAGGTLTLETGFTGVRTGDYEPPPFTPAEVVLPDGGLDGGLVLDGGEGP